MQRLVLMLIGSFILIQPTRSYAGDMTICNKSNSTLEYAMIWDEGIAFIAETWKIRGWSRVGPGACVTELRSTLRQDMFLSIRKIRSDGSKIMLDYEIKDPPKYSQKYLVGIEHTYCVKSENFQRTKKKLLDLQKCPSGHYQQLFNLHAFSAPNTVLTINLN